MIELIVNHPPVGQPRHHVSVRGKHARLYLPTKHPVHAFKAAIRAVCGKRTKEAGAIAVIIDAWFPRPKSKTWKTKPMPSYWHTGKPDADNVTKAVLDALTGLAFVDDAAVAIATCRKRVCGGEDIPGVTITVTSLEATT